MLTESRYVSESQSKTDPFGSRKAVFAQIYIPDMGRLNVFSVHLSWESAGLLPQTSNLISFVEEKEGEDVIATIVCGDFNDEPTGKGYQAMIDAGLLIVTIWQIPIDLLSQLLIGVNELITCFLGIKTSR